jgi:hypothetical protein
MFDKVTVQTLMHLKIYYAHLWVKYFYLRNYVLKSMKFLLNMFNLNKIMNKLCMESCIPYYGSSRSFLKKLPIFLMTLYMYIHIVTTYSV